MATRMLSRGNLYVYRISLWKADAPRESYLHAKGDIVGHRESGFSSFLDIVEIKQDCYISDQGNKNKQKADWWKVTTDLIKYQFCLNVM